MKLLKPLRSIFRRKPESRAMDPSWTALRGLSGLSTAPGTIGNPRIAETLAITTACVDRIADGVASLPAYVYQLQGQGRAINYGHPLMRLIRRGPNDWQAWPDFMHWVLRQVLLWGNAMVEIVTDSAGRVVALRPIPWWCVYPLMLPSGRLVYDVTEITTIYGGTGRQRRLLDYEVIHLKDASEEGLIGKPRLARASLALESALILQEFHASFFKNGARPGGVLRHPEKLSDDAAKRLRQSWEELHGGRNQGKVAILEEGMDYAALTATLEDSELLDARKFSAEEIARIFQVPPPLVGIWDNSSFTNSETAGRWFAQHTLGPWIRKIECEFARKIFTDTEQLTHEIEFDLSGLLRGDPETRWKSHEIAVNCGILSPNEVRCEEGWNPRPDGEALKNQAQADPTKSQTQDGQGA